jgi:hypothetical protein
MYKTFKSVVIYSKHSINLNFYIITIIIVLVHSGLFNKNILD